MRPIRRSLATLSLATLAGWLLCAPNAVCAVNGETAFWVWNRAEPLTSNERNALQTAGVGRLYWQAGELELHGGELRFRRTAELPPAGGGSALEIIPVVRVSTAIRSPEQFSGDAFGEALRTVADSAPGREVQIDFDCPDRLLPVYAERLRAARQIAGIRRLTITALAGWADAPAREELWGAVDAVFPMLYDVTPEPAAAAPASPFQPRPLLDPNALSAELRSWGRCPIPWFAGLPAFARITVYNAAGRSRGNLRGWDWEDLVFNAALTLARPPANGATILRAVRPTRVGESEAAAGEYVVARAVDRPAVRAAIAAAKAAGARGIVLFRLPDPAAAGGGWSLTQLLALLAPGEPDASAPRLGLRRTGDAWALRNESATDLPPCFGSPGRGYALELEIGEGAAGWREAQPGDFHRVVGHVFTPGASGETSPGEKPAAVAIPLARRLTFWFAELPAHATLTTGFVQLAPGIDPATVRFRVPVGEQPESTSWQSPE